MSGSRLYLIIGSIVVLAILGLIAFSSRTQTTPVATPLPTTLVTSSPEPTGREIVINLEEQNNSSESGTATISEEGGKVMVSLNLTGAPTNIAQPAHIHVGKCPKPDAVKYPLTSVMNGDSATTLDITLDQLLSELPLAVNVHKSSAQANIYVACGDIPAQ